jgi:hypothetical protein
MSKIGFINEKRPYKANTLVRSQKSKHYNLISKIYNLLAELKIRFQRIPSRILAFLVENQINRGLPTI